MQLSYDFYHLPAFEGQLALPGEASVIKPAVNATGAVIPMGRFVVVDAANSSGADVAMKLPGGASVAADVMGILMQSHAHPTQTSASVYPIGNVADGFSGNVVRQGTVWMKAEEACGPADVPFMRITADANPVGGVRKSADAGEAISLAGLAKFVSVAAAPGDMVMVAFLIP